MNFIIKTKVFKSLVICLTLLLICSCDSSVQKQFKQQKKEKHLTNNKEKSKEQSVENVSSKEVVSIEYNIEKEKVEKRKTVEKVISDSSKSINKNTQETNTNKYSENPFAGTGGTNSHKEPGRDHGNGSAKCYGSELRFYDKDTLSIKRYYVSIPNTSNIKNEEFCKISFKASVDANGDIISVRVNSYGTTTTNQELINQVREIVKSELKYNKVDPNTPLFSDLISITIQPN
ncbi:MAG: hypothetical protein ACK479_05160 [Fluviicola sp.]